MGSGELFEYFVDEFNLTPEFTEIYKSRYKDSIQFVNEVFKTPRQKKQNEFYISALGINELFSVVRDEFRSILLFKKGMPISRWRDARILPDIQEKEYKEIYEKMMITFDQLFSDQHIFPIAEVSLQDDPNYLDIYTSILFLIKDTKTQDVTLLTTAILNKANYFVTRDEPLIKNTRTTLMESYGLNVIKPGKGFQLLRGMRKKGKHKTGS